MIKYIETYRGWNIYLAEGSFVVQEEAEWDFHQEPFADMAKAKQYIDKLIAEYPEPPVSEEKVREIVSKVVAHPRTVRQLSRACQIFTSGLGEGGYYPNLGEPRTKEALKLMEEAGVKPVFHWEANRSKEDPFTKVGDNVQ